MAAKCSSIASRSDALLPWDSFLRRSGSLADVDPDGSSEASQGRQAPLFPVWVVLQCGPFGSVFVSFGVRIILRPLCRRQNLEA
jgi:hypothetical protein